MENEDKTQENGSKDNPAFEHDSTDGKISTQTQKTPGKGIDNIGYVESVEWENIKKSSDASSITPVAVQDKESSSMTSKQEIFAIKKNIGIISIAFVFLFTAYNSMANLQSSINPQVGTTSLSVLYVALVVSCFFIPSLMIKKLREKKTIAISMLGYSSYVAAQFYPEYYTMIPTAILLGLGAAPMWSAKCTYLTTVGTRYAYLIGEKSEVVITKFFGVFFLFFQTTQIWGNLIASLVLSSDKTEIQPDDPNLEFCGKNFCPVENDNNDTNDGNSTTNVSDAQRYTMASIYLLFALLSSVIIILFVDPLSKFQKSTKGDEEEEESSLSLLIATLKHMKNPYQILIIPLTIWSGVEQAFIGADFTAGYISCGYGVYMVGYIMILYGGLDAIGSIAFTPLVKILGRVPIFIFGALANTAMIVILFSWMPKPNEHMEMYYIVVAFWGMGDAIWQTQINAFYGVIFPGQSKAAFSNYRLWESIGFIIAYVCSTLICVDAKIYILIGFLSSGMIGYLAIEILEFKKRKNQVNFAQD